MEEILLLFQKTYGVIGFFLAAPVISTIYLWKQNQALHKENQKIADQRVDDTKQVFAKMVEICTEQSAINKESNIVLERMVNVVEVNSRTLERLAGKIERD